MDITISASSIGGNAGPFTITDNLSNTLATGVTRNQILSGYTILGVDNSATSVTLTSSGTCDNQTVININNAGSITILGVRTSFSGAAGTLTIRVNGDIVISRTTDGSTSVTCSPGDTVQATVTGNTSITIRQLYVFSSTRGVLFNETSDCGVASPTYTFTAQAGESLEIEGAFDVCGE
jgi:hypothetical protein